MGLMSGDTSWGIDLSSLLGEKKEEDTRIYTPAELAELNKVVAATGNLSALSDNVKAQLENTYTPEQKALRDWSNAKQAAEKENYSKSLTNAFGSLMTAGISDVAQGKIAGSGISELHPVAKMLNPVTFGLNVGTGGLSDIAYGIDKAGKTSGSWLDKAGAGLDRLMDINGVVDEGTRYLGDAIYKIVPSITPYLESAGKIIGGAIGSAYLPGIGTAAGAAAGSGIGNKLGSGHRTLDYFGDIYDAIKAFASAYAEDYGGLLGKALVNTGMNALYPYINPDGKYVKSENKLSLLQDQLLSTGGDLLTNAVTGYSPSVADRYTSLMETIATPTLLGTSSKSTPTFSKTSLPTLTDYSAKQDQKEKLAKLLTDKYATYGLPLDYALYQADSEQIKDLIDSSYYA